MKNIHLVSEASEDGQEVVYPGYWIGTSSTKSKVYEAENFNAEHWAELERHVSEYTAHFEKSLFLDLNAYHASNNSDRYWRIIVSNWLIRFVRTLYYRYRLIIEISDNYENCLFHICSSSRNDLHCHLSREIFNQCESPLWSSQIYKSILDELNLDYSIETNSQEERTRKTKSENSLRAKFTDNLKLLLNQFNVFNRSHFRATYLPLHQEAALNILNLQFPTFLIEGRERVFDNIFDSERRKRIIGQTVECKDQFERIYKRLIPDCIPSIFVESFDKNKDYALKTTKPSNPKIIFTSNSYDHDDLFKLYAAERAEAGARYIVGQHGNFFNTPLLEASFEIPELDYSDAYLTWGRIPQLKKTVSAFPLTLCGKQKYPRDAVTLIDEIIVVMAPRKLNRYTWDVHREYRDYLSELKRFHDCATQIDKPFYLRPHNTFWSCPDIQEWVECNLPNFKIERRKRKRVTNYGPESLIVFTYDSTGITETLALGLTSLAYWNPDQHFVYPHLRPIYDKLYENSVFFSSPDKIANYIEQISSQPLKHEAARELAIKSFLQYNANMDEVSLTRLNSVLNQASEY